MLLPKDGENRLDFQMRNFMPNYLTKGIIKTDYSTSSLDLGNSRCGHQQPYNFFLVFVDLALTGEKKFNNLKRKNV